MGSGAAVDFLGGTPEQVPEAYDAADPATRMRSRPAAEVVVVHGDRDDDVPVESSRGLQARFDWLDYRELAGADHFDVVDPRSAVWTSVLDAVRG
jgi:pimeloyl-ACP methyl ester carboxylesterase